MDNQSKTENGSPYWIARQREICNQAMALEDGAPLCSIPLFKRFVQDEITALDALEAKTKLLDKVLPEGTPAWMAYNAPTVMTPKDAAMQIREHMRHHGISEPQSIGISTALLMGADALEREDEKNATITRLTAERDAEKKRADAAEHKIYEIAHNGLCYVCDCDNNLCAGNYDETGDGCPFVNLFHCEGVSGAVDPNGPCAENSPDANAAAKEARGDADRN